MDAEDAIPIYEFKAPCGIRFERYFPRVDVKTLFLDCPHCGASAERVPSVPAFTEFVPFVSTNILPSGEAVYVRDRAQLRSLMREHKLVQLGNDPVRNHFGSSSKSVPREGGDGIAKKTRIRSHAVAPEKAMTAAREAERTDFGRRAL